MRAESNSLPADRGHLPDLHAESIVAVRIVAIGDDQTPASAGASDPAAPSSRAPDSLIAALARYVEALHRRYPDGPEQMRREGLDGRAKVSGMVRISTERRAS